MLVLIIFSFFFLKGVWNIVGVKLVFRVMGLVTQKEGNNFNMCFKEAVYLFYLSFGMVVYTAV